MAKTTKKKVKLGAAQTSKKAPQYSIEVLVNDIEYKGKADSLAQALTDFIESGDFPYGVKTRALIRFKKGSVERQKAMHVPEARRIFNLISSKPTALDLFASRLEAGLE